MPRFSQLYLMPYSLALLVLLSTIGFCYSAEDGLSNYSIIDERINAQMDLLKLGLSNVHSKVKNIIKTQYNMSEILSELEMSLNNLSTLNDLIQKDLNYLFQKNVGKEKPSYDEHFNSLESFNPISRAMTIPSNCDEATLTNNLKEDIYLLNIPYGNVNPFFAYCTYENNVGKAWTIIQRRENGEVDFNRKWSDYVEGFGDLYGEYWLGLERLHAMTAYIRHELWIQLEDYDGQKRFAKYSIFSVAKREFGYKLTVSGYSGTAGDAFSFHNNAEFSTVDVNKNGGKTNCARNFKGGWWYLNCYNCNLNGVYYSLSNHKTEFGVNWNSFNNSLRYTHMAIRPL